ncbi:TetR/AcrR family transcriptional regulator [Tistrella mobilis]|uniref:Transcriptional regulator, TetR family n=1 Tax=Tistrella mobilis (strain KA081020-065) TaxID=1110502 RepID=I3TKU5_TISMK|nr:TetR/AcrR family transcriptional regulator [Tistrella mobilis]AFK53383.1 transcriptional regulator, TetR family [Tistrella mobilis KA081020-065]
MRLPARDRRERLARAAADLFHERGYDAVSLRDIAARAGVPAGAVFYHFPTKAALATVAADAQLNRAEEILARAAEGRSPEERLTIIATGLAAGAPLAARHGCPIQRLARDLANGGEAERVARETCIRAATLLRTSVAAELKAGGVDADRADIAARDFTARWAGSAVLAFLAGDPAPMTDGIAAALNDLRTLLSSGSR